MEQQELPLFDELKAEDMVFEARPVAALEWWVYIDNAGFGARKLLDVLDSCIEQVGISYPSSLLPNGFVRDAGIRDLFKRYGLLSEEVSGSYRMIRVDVDRMCDFQKTLIASYEKAMCEDYD